MLRKLKLLEKENDLLKKELEELRAFRSPEHKAFRSPPASAVSSKLLVNFIMSSNALCIRLVLQSYH